MSEILTTEDYKGHKIDIVPDECPHDPRKEWDNFGKMVCWHKRYDLGDKHSYSDSHDFFHRLACEVDPTAERRIEYWESRYVGPDNSDARIKAIIEKALDANVVMLPLYLYDHSGITMSTGPFSCPWDSRQVGWIYATREMIKKELCDKPLTAAVRQHVRQILTGEVEVYDQYLTGDVYGFEAKHEPTGWEDSCWGFYGSDYVMEQAKGSVDWHVEQLRKEKIKQTKAFITHKVPLEARR